MRAVVCRRLAEDFGQVAVDDAWPDPVAGRGQVLVRVAAASVNYPDLLMCQGRYQYRPDPPFVPGMNLAGTVATLGADVTGLAVGDRVAGSVRTGAFAEMAAVDAGQLRAVPAALSLAVAAAYPSAYLTAYVALVRRANLQAGETLLVHGAAGGVGLATVDLGRILGARVIATSSSADKRAALAAYGADHVLDVSCDFAAEVKALTEGRGADVVFDPVGGDVFDQSARCTAFDGRLLSIGFTGGCFATLATNYALIKGFSVMGVRAGEYGRRFPDKGQENIDAIWSLAAEGVTRPRVHREFPLDQAVAAMAELRDRRVIGKAVVRCDR